MREPFPTARLTRPCRSLAASPSGQCLRRGPGLCHHLPANSAVPGACWLASVMAAPTPAPWSCFTGAPVELELIAMAPDFQPGMAGAAEVGELRPSLVAVDRSGCAGGGQAPGRGRELVDPDRKAEQVFATRQLPIWRSLSAESG